MNAKILTALLESATAESLIQPDMELNRKSVEGINSRVDLPKEAVKVLKRRLANRNQKVQYLTLELLDYLMKNCGLPFHTQVGSKEFMSQLVSLLNLRDLDARIHQKILDLIQRWAIRFQKEKDILPLFTDVYTSFKGKGIEFPALSAEEQRMILDTRPVSTSTTASAGPKSGGSKSPTNPKFKKLKQDLELVKQNIFLTNEMIDAADPRDDVNTNDVLKELVQTLKTMEQKLMNLITTLTEEDMMEFALHVNDDLHKTFTRFETLKRHRKPEPFVSSDPDAVPQQQPQEKIQPQREEAKNFGFSQPQSQPTAKKSENLLDIFGGEEPQQTQPQHYPSFQAPPVGLRPTPSQTGPSNNLFELGGGPSAHPVQTQPNLFPPQQQPHIEHPQTFQTAPVQPPKASNDDPIAKLNEIMTKMKDDKDKQQQQQIQQQQPQANMAAAVFGNMGGAGYPQMGGYPSMGAGGYPGFMTAAPTGMGMNPMMGGGMGQPPQMQPNPFGGMGGMGGSAGFSTSYPGQSSNPFGGGASAQAQFGGYPGFSTQAPPQQNPFGMGGPARTQTQGFGTPNQAQQNKPNNNNDFGNLFS